MKRIVVLLAPLLMLIAAGALAHEGHEHAKKGTKPVMLTGEVIDITCFLHDSGSATGAEHAKCAKSCIKQGNPVGFLTENGTVYILIGDDHEPIATKVVEYAGAKSNITGVVIERHGLKGIELVSINPAVAGAKAAGQPGGMPGTAPVTRTANTPAVMYTCAMHPEIHQATPGDCPKCGMTLIPEKKK